MPPKKSIRRRSERLGGGGGKDKDSTQSRQLSAHLAVNTLEEDDGTQVEKDERKTKAKGKKGAPPEHPNMKVVVRDFCVNACKLGIQGLVKEFAEIRTQTQPIGSKSKIGFDKNGDKNRYKDVYCVDNSRVILKWPSESSNDYIHANWVQCDVTCGADKGKFICTQGPTDKTSEDFWRMMWQEKVKAVIMLCNVMEQGKKKCEQYWPINKGDEATYGHVKIRNTGNVDFEKTFTVTKLEVTAEGEKETLKVEHLLWNNWPDRGVPENFMATMRLLHRVRNHIPIAVHCSAGIGRTGTIVGLDILYARLSRGESATLAQVMRELRDCRHGSIQTDIQYVYMHRVFFTYASNRRDVEMPPETKQFLADYEALCKARGI